MFLLLALVFTAMSAISRAGERDVFFSPAELANYLDLPVNTIYRWNHAGGGPKRLKVGKHVRYRLSDVNRWLEAQADPQPGV